MFTNKNRNFSFCTSNVVVGISDHVTTCLFNFPGVGFRRDNEEIGHVKQKTKSENIREFVCVIKAIET